MKTNKGMVLAAVIALAPCIAGAQAMVTERSISLNAALDAAKAGLERCRADGYKVTVTVLNRHARTAVVLSDDGVNPHTIENSMRRRIPRSRHAHRWSKWVSGPNPCFPGSCSWIRLRPSKAGSDLRRQGTRRLDRYFRRSGR